MGEGEGEEKEMTKTCSEVMKHLPKCELLKKTGIELVKFVSKSSVFDIRLQTEQVALLPPPSPQLIAH